MSEVGGGGKGQLGWAAQQWAIERQQPTMGRATKCCVRCRFKFFNNGDAKFVNNFGNAQRQQQWAAATATTAIDNRQSTGHKSYLYLRCRHIK